MAWHAVTPDLFDRVLLNDLEKMILRIDDRILPERFPPPVVCRMHEVDRRSYQQEGIQIGNFVSYIPLPDLSRYGVVSAISGATRQSTELYVIWVDPTVTWLKRLFEGGRLPDGSGHKAVVDQWLRLACALVRARVLSHPKWFPETRVRMLKTLLQHHGLFSQPGDELSGARTLRQEFLESEKALKNETTIDIYWTVELVMHAIEKVGFERALHLLHSETY